MALALVPSTSIVATAMALLALAAVAQHDGMCLLQQKFELKPDFPKMGSDPLSVMVSQMQSQPSNDELQAAGCGVIAGSVRDNFESYPTATSLAAMQAAADNLKSDNKDVVRQCCLSLGGMTVFHRDISLLFNQTKGMENLLNSLQRWPDDKGVQEDCLMQLASFATAPIPELTPYVANLGGFDFVWEQLQRWNNSDGLVQLSGWKAFSDHSHNAFGAEVLTNYGGYPNGIELITMYMRTHPEYHYGTDEQTLSCKYEAMQVVNGILEHDYDNTYGDEFVRVGLLDIIPMNMRVDYDLRPANDVNCAAANWLVKRSPATHDPLVKAGILEVAAAAIDRFSTEDNLAWNHRTLGESFPVIPSCSLLLGMLAASDATYAETMRQLGVPEILARVGPTYEPLVLPLRTFFTTGEA